MERWTLEPWNLNHARYLIGSGTLTWLTISTIEQSLLYVDLHLVHEVTSPQAFSGLKAAGRRVRRPDRTFATVDHNVPTTARPIPIADALAEAQLEALRRNCAAHDIRLYDMTRAIRGSCTSLARSSA